MAYLLEGRLKITMKEVDKEKALKQVFEPTLQEKVLELALMEQRIVTVERAQYSFERKVGVLEGKLEDSDSKLAQA